jgi:hypothetical protein
MFHEAGGSMHMSHCTAWLLQQFSAYIRNHFNPAAHGWAEAAIIPNVYFINHGLPKIIE